MVYVQYFQESAMSNELIEVLGDRGVVVLDGRNKLETYHKDAVAFNGFRRAIYKAYQLMKGNSFSDSSPFSEIVKL